MNKQTNKNTERLNIAVIGTGISGLSAAWLLNQGHHVTVFEQNDYVGGHSHTVIAEDEFGKIPIDTGFIVYNETNYPNLTALFDYLDVPTEASEMSFSASLDGGLFEYSGTNLNGLFGQRSNIINPRFWRMMSGILRFYKEAPSFLAESNSESISLGDYLRRRNYSAAFINDHLLPMGAAIWSTTSEEIQAYPAHAFIRFFQSHGLLNIIHRPSWRTVKGGSTEYVKRLSATFEDRIFLDAVISVIRTPDNLVIKTKSGKSLLYDHVVIATHADQAIKLIMDPNDIETKLLSPWRYTQNRTILHRDKQFMPKETRTWSSWNFIGAQPSKRQQSFSVTYWMNKLQNLESKNDYLVTLNPSLKINPEAVILEQEYTHPFFDAAALKSQKFLWDLQGVDRLWFCGSYFGYGFHEDGLQSGLAVAEALGSISRPWNVVGQNNRLPFSERHGASV